MGAQEETKGPVYGTPMYVALVDVCGGDDYLELVKSALQAALEAIPSGSLFGLITFSDKVHSSWWFGCRILRCHNHTSC